MKIETNEMSWSLPALPKIVAQQNAEKRWQQCHRKQANCNDCSRERNKEDEIHKIDSCGISSHHSEKEEEPVNYQPDPLSVFRCAFWVGINEKQNSTDSISNTVSTGGRNSPAPLDRLRPSCGTTRQREDLHLPEHTRESFAIFFCHLFSRAKRVLTESKFGGDRTNISIIVKLYFWWTNLHSSPSIFFFVNLFNKEEKR
jgi:hypothetical protein